LNAGDRIIGVASTVIDTIVRRSGGFVILKVYVPYMPLLIVIVFLPTISGRLMGAAHAAEVVVESMPTIVYPFASVGSNAPLITTIGLHLIKSAR
jgi:hypothetical protein